MFSNSVLYRERQYLYKAYPNHVMEKVKRHFLNMKIIKVTQTKHNETAAIFSEYIAF
ncbi:hypothetical protein CDIV41_10021 [Carnobacterium divergens]|nr:hypothetical protein CDIV41_10021 [Carnobacterium divergens]